MPMIETKMHMIVIVSDRLHPSDSLTFELASLSDQQCAPEYAIEKKLTISFKTDLNTRMTDNREHDATTAVPNFHAKQTGPGLGFVD